VELLQQVEMEFDAFLVDHTKRTYAFAQLGQGSLFLLRSEQPPIAINQTTETAPDIQAGDEDAPRPRA
jgi:hypothetical protein